jgi:antitoxin (DNA-binding transcriptional repressor) of toxin-antitoxin stability system
MQATAKDLRFHTRELLEVVDRGEEVLISFRGKLRAKMVPPDVSDQDREDASALFGIWGDNEQVQEVDTYVRSIRKGRRHVD